MFVLIGALLVALAVAELYVMILVGQAIGVLNTVALVIASSVIGFWLAKREGFSVLGKIRGQLQAGKSPTNEVIDGGLVLVGGLLLIVPGFITDAFGLLLLFRPTRKLARNLVKRRFNLRVFGTTTAPRRVPNEPAPQLEDPYRPDNIVDI